MLFRSSLASLSSLLLRVVRPEVKLGKYLGVQVTKIDTSVSDEEVAEALEKERNNNARTVSVTDRAVAMGDTAVIDFRDSLMVLHLKVARERTLLRDRFPLFH